MSESLRSVLYTNTSEPQQQANLPSPLHAMCVTREQLFYGDRYSYNRFRPSRLGAGLAAMFPGLPCVDVDSLDGLRPAMRSALAADGPSVVSIECSPDEIPPFLPFMADGRPEVLSSKMIG